MRRISRVVGSISRSRSRRERAAALVEFALIMPLLMILILGTMDFGFMINRDALINSAAKEGAREGAVNPVAADMEAVVRSNLASLDQTALTVTISCRKPDTNPCTTFAADAESGGVGIVQVDYEYTWLSFAPRVIGLGPTHTLSKTIEMRIE
jgi:Flp pilus assembly protein TadG